MERAGKNNVQEIDRQTEFDQRGRWPSFSLVPAPSGRIEEVQGLSGHTRQVDRR